MPDDEQQREGHLREAFVEMLFALAVAQVGINAADLAEFRAPWQCKLPALAHLAVGLILIAASWLGWKLSGSWRKRQLLKQKQKFSLFSVAFLGLLLDVILVILYFIIVRIAEIKETGNVITVETPSARPESWWIIWVFVVYAAWDLVTDVFDEGSIPANAPSLRWLKTRIAFVSTLDSVICVALTYLVFTIACNRASIFATIILDLALISVILLFRLLKTIETPLSTGLRVREFPAFASPRLLLPHERRWRLAFAIVYVLCLLAAWWLPDAALNRTSCPMS